jgi:colanic acid/amylovoran biosynthesis glycosyltransferase
MKVLVFAQGFGGRTLTFIYNEVIALSKHCEVWVVCNHRGIAEKFPYDNVVEIPFEESSLKKKIKWQLWKSDLHFGERNKKFSKAFNEAVDKIKPDVIHCHFGNEAVRVTDNFSRTDIPVLVTFHGYDATQFDKKKNYVKKMREVFSRPNVYPMFVSDYIKKRVGQMGIDTERGYKLYLGIDLEKFVRTQFPSKEKEIHFLQVSSFAPQKGHHITVPVIKKFLEQNHNVPVKFTFGGAGGTQTDVIKKLVADLNLQDKIHFTGRLDPIEVKQWMEKAHYFLHHSVTGPYGETEGLPTAIMEAMAMELPVLTTHHAGIPELVENNVNGILINEGDEDAYLQKLNEMMKWSYVPANRTKVQEMCEIKNHTIKLIDIYKQVISKK